MSILLLPMEDYLNFAFGAYLRFVSWNLGFGEKFQIPNLKTQINKKQKTQISIFPCQWKTI